MECVIKNSTLFHKKLQKQINADPKLPHEEIFEDNNAQPRTGWPRN